MTQNHVCLLKGGGVGGGGWDKREGGKGIRKVTYSGISSQVKVSSPQTAIPQT